MKLLLRAVFALALGTVAIAPAAADPTEDYFRLHLQYMEAVKKAKARGALPRASDPAIATLLASLADRDRFLSRTMRWDEINNLTRICALARLRVVDYLSFDPAAKETKAVPVPAFQPFAESPLTANNWARYQDELTPQLGFFLRCGFKALAMAERKVKESTQVALPERSSDAIVEMTDMLSTHFMNLANNLRNDKLTIAHRLQMLAVLRADAMLLIDSLDLQTRSALKDYFTTLANITPAEMRDDILVMAKLSESRDCVAICKL